MINLLNLGKIEALPFVVTFGITFFDGLLDSFGTLEIININIFSLIGLFI